MKYLPFSVLIMLINIEISTMQLTVDKIPSAVGGVFLGELIILAKENERVIS